MSYSFLTLFLTICFSVAAQGDVFQQEIMELLQCNGTQEEYSKAYDDVFDLLKKNFETADVPDPFWTDLKKGKDSSLAEVTQFLTFAYRNHFSRPEIAEMIVFYQTEAAQKMLKINTGLLTEAENKLIAKFQNGNAGKKLAANRQALTADINEIAGHWSRDLFAANMSALIKAGYSPKQ